MKVLKKFLKPSKEYCYSTFDKIDGSHPLKKEMEDMVVEYQARKRHGGKLAYFNYELARDMGLISKDHPNEMNKELEGKILDTFSIVIINEYDLINEIEFPEKDILDNTYMATRYLQLQHPNKQGKTSGDGRSIWNGQWKNRGKRWDISSCGTGATRLSPATSINKKYYQTGDPQISYGCGYSEIDEGLCTAIFSETLYKNGYSTERALAIIDYGDGISINVRAHENLLRPSHVFRYLKLGNRDSLEKLLDYYIDRQVKNKKWKDVPEARKARFEYFMNEVTHSFANVSADFEDDYIFCWMDWDGDNILMDGGVIDYGSIRQFGMFHSEYRYDDTDRYSTSIVEQKKKAKSIIEFFAQSIDFVLTGKKKSISSYAKGKWAKKFESDFRSRKNRNILVKMGMAPKWTDYLLNECQKDIEKFRSCFSYFERSKSVEGIYEVADGITRNAIFCMRDLLREHPQLLLVRESGSIKAQEFIDILASSYALEEDLKITSYRKKKIREYQKFYMKLVEKVTNKFDTKKEKVLLEITMRSSVVNKYDRVTGDAVTTIVKDLLRDFKKISPDQLFQIISDFVEFQNLNPGGKESLGKKKSSKHLRNMVEVVRDFREGL